MNPIIKNERKKKIQELFVRRLELEKKSFLFILLAAQKLFAICVIKLFQ